MEYLGHLNQNWPPILIIGILRFLENWSRFRLLQKLLKLHRYHETFLANNIRSGFKLYDIELAFSEKHLTSFEVYTSIYQMSENLSQDAPHVNESLSRVKDLSHRLRRIWHRQKLSLTFVIRHYNKPLKHLIVGFHSLVLQSTVTEAFEPSFSTWINTNNSSCSVISTGYYETSGKTLSHQKSYPHILLLIERNKFLTITWQ